MKAIKEKILQAIIDNSLKYDVKDLALLFQMAKTTDYVKLNKYLNELEADVLIVRDDNNKFMDAKEANIAKGIISINKRGVGFVDLDENKSVRFDIAELKGAMNKDEVIYTVDKNNEKEGFVLKIIKRNKTQLVGTFVDNKKSKLVFIPDDQKISNKVIVTNMNDYSLVEGSKVVCKIIKYGEKITVVISALLGHIDDPHVDIESVLISCGTKMAFDYETLKEANSIPNAITEESKKNRHDLTDVFTATIDGADSKDFDDAISIEKFDNNWNLKVHIADVSYYVIENSNLDKEARIRGTSTYVVNKVVPMLPHVLSNGICSLNPGVERLTITCDMDLDNEGNVTKYEVYPSVIKSDQRMTYDDVNKILLGDLKVQRDYQDCNTKFFDMLELSKLIRYNRHVKGSIDFDRAEAQIVVDDNGRVVDIKIRERYEAERLIEDFMILANENIANLTRTLKIPSLYRVHEQPNVKRVENFMKFVGNLGYKFKSTPDNIEAGDFQLCLANFKDKEEFPVISTMMLRSMAKARYDEECLGHFGLASKEYSHFTSPIRRYPDLIVHRYLRKYHFKKNVDKDMLKKDNELVQQLGIDTSICERRSVEAERAVDDMKKAEYMQSHLGENFEGVISSVTNFGLFVELDNTVEGLVKMVDLDDDYYNFNPEKLSLTGMRTNKTYTMGQKIRVKCVRADKIQRSVDFVIKNDKKTGKSAKNDKNSKTKKYSKTTKTDKRKKRKSVRRWI
jgi:ribonuclease R